MSRGKFIVIDGGDGVGKSSVVSKLKEEFPEIFFTREPGGTSFGEGIRDVLLSDRASEVDSIAMMLGFFSVRLDHAHRLIGKALQEGRHVITDRFDAVTYAYQVHAGRPELEAMFDVLRMQVARFAEPDFYIILDASPEIAMARKHLVVGHDHFDRRGLDWKNQVREGFIHFVNKYVPKNHVIVDASQPFEKVYADVVKTLKSATLLA